MIGDRSAPSKEGSATAGISGTRTGEDPAPCIRPFSLERGEYGPVYVGITPREAVIAAYAQSRGDWNTWDYATRYGHLVRINKGGTLSCGEGTNVWSVA